MFRKTLIAAAAAATLALGLGAATAPAQAGINIIINGGGYYQPVGHYYGHVKQRAPYHCHVKKVWRYGHWVKVKNCHRAWH
jgi:hypothetical protein